MIVQSRPHTRTAKRHVGRYKTSSAAVWSRWNSARSHASLQQGDTVHQDLLEGKLFSNLDSGLKHDPGSVVGSALLVAGTTVGAGILALPAVTQDAGFIPAASTLTACCLFSIATGLLVSEVHLNIMRQQGAGNVSLVTMARQTLGDEGAAAASLAYVFLHYALLVAYMSKAGEIAGGALGLPLLPSAALFAGSFALLCYGSSQRLLDQLNGALVLLVVSSFLGLLFVAGSGIDAASLVTHSNWAAVPATLPVVALAFVYHNIVPVINTALEGDVAKIRTAVVAGVAVPWAMFVSWEGAILGSLGAAAATQPAVSTAVAAVTADSSEAARQMQEVQLAAAAEQVLIINGFEASFTAPAVRYDSDFAAAHTQQHWQPMGQTSGWQEGPVPPQQQLMLPRLQDPYTRSSASEASNAGMQLAPCSCELQDGCCAASAVIGKSHDLAASTAPAGFNAEAHDSSSSSSAVDDPGLQSFEDPLAALSAANPVVAPLIQAFSFLAIATSYIGFILGLTDFLADALALPGGRQSALPYLITVLPPFAVAVTNPDIFLKALDTAGTYGVLTLFGIMPAAMAWRQRYDSNGAGGKQARLEVVPGGRVALLCIGGAAAGVIGNEVAQLFS